jgi:hypothetical protein
VKYFIWGIVGLVVLVVVAGGVGAYWVAHYKVDFKDPQVAAKFKESFNGTCVANFQKELAKKNGTAPEVDLSKVDEVCTCARDGVVDAFAKRDGMTVTELATAMGSDPEIVGITNACSAKLGIAAP